MKICQADGCKEKSVLHNYCRKHWEQIQRYGEIRNRSNRDPNNFVIKGDVCIIDLYNRYSEKIAETIIDAEDYEKCKEYKWCLMSMHPRGRYVMNNTVGKLAQFILGVKTSVNNHLDHINGDTLDNRKSNLRVITNQQNQLKKKIQVNNRSGYRGVHWYQNPGKTSAWEAHIRFNKKGYFLGRFKSKHDAAKAYNEKAIELFGEFAVLNVIRERRRLQSDYT